ncbi:MAG: HAD hydrolase family protein [Candidatus Levyibacteriota bacterium]
MISYIFDVDGVLTNILAKQANPELLSQVADLLKNGNVVVFNTGRSFPWLIEHILTPFQKYIYLKEFEGKFLAVCEMGNIVYEFQEGSWKETIDPSTSVPESLKAEIRQLVQTEYAESMFFDDKKTMVSVEVIDGYDSQEYLQQQKKLMDQIHQILQKPEYKNCHLKTGSNQIALDVQNEISGKNLGAEKIMDWLKKQGFQINSVVTFGDNASDLEMAEAFVKEFTVEFVYAGKDRDQIDSSKYPFKITFTKSLYDEGTLEYLRN